MCDLTCCLTKSSRVLLQEVTKETSPKLLGRPLSEMPVLSLIIIQEARTHHWPSVLLQFHIFSLIQTTSFLSSHKLDNISQIIYNIVKKIMHFYASYLIDHYYMSFALLTRYCFNANAHVADFELKENLGEVAKWFYICNPLQH